MRSGMSAGRAGKATAAGEPLKEIEMIGEALGVTEDQVKSVLRARRARADMFAPDLFSDPAWDIVLELLAARLTGRGLALGELGNFAPPTTIARWVGVLEQNGVVSRQPRLEQGGDCRIELTADAASKTAAILRHLWGRSER
jgi:hypothetical protein